MMARWLSKYTAKTPASIQRGWPTMGKDKPAAKPGRSKKSESSPQDYRKDDFLRDLRKVARRLERDRGGRSPRES